MKRDEAEEWKIKYSQKAHKSILRPLRVWQYNRTVDDEALFEFNLCRKQTRYRQRNYVKTPYEVMNTVETFDCDYDYVVGRYRELEKIGFETTTSRYRVKNQRRLMTQELKERIKLRDNYTCQICGKYMPDEVGLQIDHIVPVSKGGKTIESNLQVLCSVCNGRKSNKL
ncbi:MAG: HNH endonuclease [Lachnospiraceae bacterium]|nr:HNH endonuclease [Lachnospiraceae bacterium]